jgi:alpha-2-macroglobulin
MKPSRIAALLLAASLLGHGQGQLTVIRVHPSGPADPRTEITVTFDRPVSGGLDAIVDAASIFRIDPAVAGRVEWRDPVTLRFTPAVPLQPGASYAVTIAHTFEAMDGTRLRQPYTFRVSIEPARVLAGSPIGPHTKERFIPPQPVLSVLLTATAAPGLIAERSWIAMGTACGGGRIRLEPVRIRPVAEDDVPALRWTGGYYSTGDTLRDLRRVLELRPAAALPRDCDGVLHVVTEARAGAPTAQWPFRTYGALQVDSVACGRAGACPTGPIRVVLSTPVTGAELQRRLRVHPQVEYGIADTSRISHQWVLDARLQPRQSYAVTIDSLLTDVFGQRLGATAVRVFRTTSYAPTVTYDHGRLLVERNGARTLAVQVVNVDTLIVTTISVPVAAEATFLSQTRRWSRPVSELRHLAVERRIPVRGERDVPFIVGVPVGTGGATGVAPRSAHAAAGDGTLLAVRVRHSGQAADADGPVALVQVTDLAVHGRLGLEDGVVWVTGVGDGRPRADVAVTVHDAQGAVRARARTDADGFARITGLRPRGPDADCQDECNPAFDGYVAAVLGADRAVVGFNAWDPDLAAWNFGVWSAWSTDQRMTAAAAVFTERGIYRPGERVYAKAIVRSGPLGALVAPRGDSLKWEFLDRDYQLVRDTVTTLSSFGTADQSFPLGSDVPLGFYAIRLRLQHGGEWHVMAETSYQVAEYRPPEFLVDVNADPAPRHAGDEVDASVTARYLFGAPMAGARVRLLVQHRPMHAWELEIPGADGWQIGGYDFDEHFDSVESTIAEERVDTLDAQGALDVSVRMPATENGRAARTGILAVVTDANRQTVSAGRSIVVHPAAFYVGAKSRGDDWFWRAGTPVELDVIALRPDGERVSGVRVAGVVVRREWHRVRRVRDGQLTEVGSWVADTVATCAVQTTATPAPCRFTPTAGGSYMVAFTAHDAQGRIARTTMWRWAAGPGFVPWRDETKLRMEIIPDRQRYSVGDTATLLIASPFTDVNAWLTIERERVLESRPIRITAGASTVRVPITEELAPNAFVSVLLVRGRSAAPGPLDDPGRPALRVGYTELRVVPEVKRLDVQVAPLQPEYRPGDTARVSIAVSTPGGGGQRAEVTLWAVDEGVLALTGYRTPDPVELLYRPRPLGSRLASNLAAVAAQVPEGQKGGRAAGGSGGSDIGGVLRSRFQTTAFFLGSVVTDADGRAVAAAALPDNLTTFRIMAVAVTAGDRYGAGSSSLLVTRPLVARPALPRFVREGDRFAAGVLVNQRTGGSQRVDVEAEATGIVLAGPRRKRETLNGAAAREVTFDFTAQAGDSARLQFMARGRSSSDAVAVRIPVRPAYHPLARTVAGALRDTATVEFVLDPDIDPARSTLEVSFGSSTLAVVRGAQRTMRVYPYYCTEQVASAALPLIALYRAQQQLGANVAPATAEADIQAAVRTLLRRQNADGGVGYWGANDWTTPWLSGYAARVLIEARAAGFAVDSTALNRLADYLARSLHHYETGAFAVARWHELPDIALSERVAAADVLSRLGRADVPVEHTLLGQAGRMLWEDRVLLAEMMARRGALDRARPLLASAWQGVTQAGRTLVLPAAGRRHYFHSGARPAARLLTATLRIEPEHPQLGLLVETLVQQGRAAAAAPWNTQDYGATVLALMEYERQRPAHGGTVRIDGARGPLLARTLARGEVRDTTMALVGLVHDDVVRLRLAGDGAAPAYYYLTVREVPRARPVRPVDNGIQVDRWYERPDTRAPVTNVAAGELVRVRLRVTVPVDRHFVVLDDPLPAGLEAVDLSLRTVQPPGFSMPDDRGPFDAHQTGGWHYGSWDSGMWSVFDHRELRDDRVVYFATYLWTGTHTATYLARATTAGSFAMPPAHAEEMYNPAVNGRTGGGTFTVTPPRR